MDTRLIIWLIIHELNIRICFFVSRSVFLISSYGAPLGHRASYSALHSSLFGPLAQVTMIILSVTALTLS